MGLDLQALGAAAVGIGMELAGNAKSTCTLTPSPGGAYDPVADSVPAATTVTAIPCLPYRRRNRKAAEEVEANTRTLLIEAAAFSARCVAAGLPANTDIREHAKVGLDGHQWSVTDAERDPTGASWLVDIRR